MEFGKILEEVTPVDVVCGRKTRRGLVKKESRVAEQTPDKPKYYNFQLVVKGKVLETEVDDVKKDIQSVLDELVRDEAAEAEELEMPTLYSDLQVSAVRLA